jgi:hypothetical protein
MSNIIDKAITDSLKVPATAQEWLDLTEGQMCALAVHYRVILQSEPKRSAECCKQWNKMPAEMFMKWSRYVIETSNAARTVNGQSTAPWAVQAEAVKKFGLI